MGEKDRHLFFRKIPFRSMGKKEGNRQGAQDEQNRKKSLFH
jgi:hypothetical protein